MKKCKIYSTTKKAEAEAVVIDKCVLLPAPRRDDVEPAHISDGQCYYPPLYVINFTEGMNFNLIPFSVECEWGEYSDADDSPVRSWFSYYCGDDYTVKCGYCDTTTGKICIPPEMEHCEDFNEYGAAIFGGLADFDYNSEIYNDVSDEIKDKRKSTRAGVCSGLMNTKGEIISCRGYVGIEESHYGVFFGYQTADGWGVADSEGSELIEPLWAGISWDGMGGFTVESVTSDGRKTYAIINGSNWHDGEVVRNLTEEPTIIYSFPEDKRRENLSWEEHFYQERFRLTQKGDRYGLVRDVLENRDEPLYTYSEEILEPNYLYEDIPDAAYQSWIDAQIYYYAHIMSRTPRNLPGRIGDGWDDVPADIVNEVKKHMISNDMKQPETIEEVES